MSTPDDQNPEPPASDQPPAPTDRPWFGALRRYANNVESHDWDHIRQKVDEARSRPTSE
jgi:hypothetical protein